MLCKFRPLLNIRTTKALSTLKNVDGPVFVRSAPGSRCLELGHPDDGNHITEDVLKTLSHHMQKLEENHTVGLMIMASRSPDRFSDGFPRTDKGVSKELVQAANALSVSISTMKKESLAVFSGAFDSTAYSTFAACKYRLGTESTLMAVNVFKNGRLHVGGGLPYFFARSSPVGHTYLRYLSVANRSINAFDMHALGLLSHVTELQPQNALQSAIGHTVYSDDQTKVQQTPGVDLAGLSDMLDTMHVLDDELTDGEEGHSDLMKDPLWDKVFLLPPKCDFPITDCDGLPELKNHQKEIEHCFGAENVEECRQRLAAIAGTHLWAAEALTKLDGINASDLKEWFRLTELASTVTLRNQLDEEQATHARLVDSL